MEGQMWSVARRPIRLPHPAVDRVSVALGAVFVAAAAFYVWTAATSLPLTLDGTSTNPYNLLARALFHLHLWVGHPPAGLLRLPEPYDPAANAPFQSTPHNIHDFALYHGRLYLTWGPTPLVLVAPLYLLGLGPSTSMTALVFAVAGLGFALAALRVVVRRLDAVPLWACTVAALALALASVVPFTLRRPEVYEEAVTAGFCFAMAGVWLALGALLQGRASWPRLALMSLCFGLATGARPPLALTAAVLVPVYLSLRWISSRRAPVPRAAAGRLGRGVGGETSLWRRRSKLVAVGRLGRGVGGETSLWRRRSKLAAVGKLGRGVGGATFLPRGRSKLAAADKLDPGLGREAVIARRRLLLALAGPVGACLLALAAYNQARFGSPLEVGVRYALAGVNQYTAHFHDLTYVPPGAWYYLLAPPRFTALFPFLLLAPPPLSYPGTLPANYLALNEITGGLVPMAPIVVFLGALPLIWRRRPEWLGPLAGALVVLAGAGLAILVALAWEFFATTERYEVDFAGLLLLGALAAWLALAVHLRGRPRRWVRVGGGVLAVWGCLAGTAISFVGYANLLAVNHPATWAKLETLTSPLRSALVTVAGGPVLAEVGASRVVQLAPASLTLDAPIRGFGLSVGEAAVLGIVSPGARSVALVASAIPRVAVGSSGASPSTVPAGLLVRGPGPVSASYPIPPEGTVMHIPVRLVGGVNRLSLTALAVPPRRGQPSVPVSSQLLEITNLSLAG